MARKTDKRDNDLLWSLFIEHGDKKWSKIHQIYNEEMDNNWTKDQLRKRVANLKSQGKVKFPDAESDEPGTSQQGRQECDNS